MNPEVVLAVGYAGALTLAAYVLEWLSAHTHRRALRYRTAGFTYSEELDHWECPEGQHLWPREIDLERRVIRYRATAHVCNRCPRKSACTDSDAGREIVRPIDPWPHSEAGRFHRVIAVLMVVLAALIALVALARHHAPAEAAAARRSARRGRAGGPSARARPAIAPRGVPGAHRVARHPHGRDGRRRRPLGAGLERGRGRARRLSSPPRRRVQPRKPV